MKHKNNIHSKATGFTSVLLLCAILTGCGGSSETSTDLTGNDTADTVSVEQSAEETTVEDETDENTASLHNKSVMIRATEFKGQFDSVEVKNGGLTLIDGARTGTFTSDEIDLGGSFKEMLASWNSSSSGGTVEISVAVKLDSGRYTDWYSWGKWSAIQGVSGSASKEDANGEISIDILTLKRECRGTVKFKVDINRQRTQLLSYTT